MKTTIQLHNPFTHNRYGYLWEVLAASPPKRHLDYGAYDGAVIAQLARSGVVGVAVGVDANAAIVNANADRMPPGAQLTTTVPRTPLPFADASFDSASLLDVLEHVVEQRGLLDELRRVLTPAGMLVVTVPRRYRLSFLDTSNWKFVFPRLHRLAVMVARDSDYYHRRFIQCENGLFGDIEVGKHEHEHFSIESLSELLAGSGFTLSDIDGAGYFGRILVLLHPLAATARGRHALARLSERDASRYEAAHLFATFRRDG